MDLKRKFGWKSDETAMRYIKDTKVHSRKMAEMVAGTSASTSPSGSKLGPPPHQPRLMPFPTPQSTCKFCLGGDTEFNLCSKEAIKAEGDVLEIKDDKTGHRAYFNLQGAQNVTINFN